MELSYYPGCSLHGTGQEYDLSIRSVLPALGVRLKELADWTCCGASSAHVVDEELAGLLAARNLALADEAGQDVVVPCAACYSRLKFAERDRSPVPGRASDGGAAGRAVRIVHLHDLLVDGSLLEELEGRVTRSLEGLKVVPYYGCLTVRPPKVTGSPNPEHPGQLDEVLRAVGATVVPWSFKTDCCGGSLSLARPDVVRKLSGDLIEAARHSGGDCLVTDCPMCQANLDTRQDEIRRERDLPYQMPVFFVTELIGLALGMRDVAGWLDKHLVDPRPVLRERGLA